MDNILSPEKLTHTRLEDTLTLLFGTLMTPSDIILFRQAGALTGETAGMAFLIYYATHLLLDMVSFVINLPLCRLFVRRMGTASTLKTFCVVGLVSLFFDLHGHFIHVDRPDPYYAILFGNIMVGIGFVVLFRHRVSLGGVNILALYPQNKSGIRAGKLQMVVDAYIVTALLWAVSLPTLLAPILGAVILNSIIAMNHRPGHYAVQRFHPRRSFQG